MGDSHDSRSRLVERERAALADLFDTVGPDAPTLCEGWLTRDLVAHLVLREGHPAAAGIVVPQLSGWTQRTQRELAQRSYPDLVERFRAGPPVWSAMRLPGADPQFNTFEHFVHHEDVRRAPERWSARQLGRADDETLWHQLVRRARWYLRGAPVPLRLAAPGFGAMDVGKIDERTQSQARVTLTGAPGELVLHVHGRRAHALVEVSGPDGACELWARHDQRA
jgi:uncharacterized protein (TIGR03085 family)